MWRPIFDTVSLSASEVSGAARSKGLALRGWELCDNVGTGSRTLSWMRRNASGAGGGCTTQSTTSGRQWSMEATVCARATPALVALWVSGRPAQPQRLACFPPAPSLHPHMRDDMYFTTNPESGVCFTQCTCAVRGRGRGLAHVLRIRVTVCACVCIATSG